MVTGCRSRGLLKARFSAVIRRAACDKHSSAIAYSARRSRFIEVLRRLDLVIWRVFKVIHVLGTEG